jgi:two-component system response regulator AtoC
MLRADQRAPAPAIPSPRSIRVLVVEDDDMIRHLLKFTLSRMGLSVETAIHGEEGWQRLSADVFDLLITDSHMPELSGLDLIGRLRASGSTMPVILMSAMMPSTQPSVRSFIQPGHLMDKPFSMLEVLESITSLIR